MKTLQLSQISYSANKENIVDTVDVVIQQNEIVALLGPNGAGKSTLIKLASGEIKPSQGEISFLDKPLNIIKPREKALHMAVLPQQSTLSFPYTVNEVVALGRTPHDTGAECDKDIVKRCLSATDMTSFQDQLYTQLSGGEKQRVQLARVFAQLSLTESAQTQESDSRLLILDEPTSALDLSHQVMVMNMLRKQARTGCSVLMVLHDINLAAQYADRVIILNKGQIAAEGDPKTLLKPELLKNIFNVDFTEVIHPISKRSVFLY